MSKKGLGKGLSALLGDGPESNAQTIPTVGGPRIENVALSDLKPNPDQPRKQFTESEIETLAASLKAKGLLQPIVVRENPNGDSKFQIVAGERRWRAAQRVPLHNVPVIVRNFSDAETLEVGLIENVQRVNLNPVEEAESYARLVKQFDYTQEQLAETIAKSRSHIANTLRLMKLPQPVLEYLRGGKLSAGHARALIGHPDARELARDAVARNLSVREVEALVGAKSKKANSPKSTTTNAKKDADTTSLEGDLSAALGATVEINHRTGGAGVVTIKYGSLDQLDAICEKFGVTN